ncbi:hypothetical protein BSL78_00943 [Apostichopus japonicus]|uniref:Peptidase metallopeptidase domain-containing protein n=1 Tax=Stichopus japonicus TaxID=307972 RepID=A0A2G8LPE0_STIJA|nr:hypothetical protein BSL78_00943 [Apostichopus japonicus]
MRYLRKYQYIEDDMMQNDEVIVALKKFQQNNNIPVTGDLDEDTLKMMENPPCKEEDANDEDRRTRRYLLARNVKWTKNIVTYNIVNTPSTISMGDVEATFRRAFDSWQNVCGLTFYQVPDPAADIQISFVRGNHGDIQNFDGPNGLLAHAFIPYNNGEGHNGDIHMDADEQWVLMNGGINLYQVALHEIGHTLSLGHSYPNTVMHALYRSTYDPNFHLSNDDIMGVQALYEVNKQICWFLDRPPFCGLVFTSPRVVSSDSLYKLEERRLNLETLLILVGNVSHYVKYVLGITASSETTATKLPRNDVLMFRMLPVSEEEIPAPEAPMPDDNCHLEFDAMATMDDGSVLAFAGQEVFHLTRPGSVSEGFPKTLVEAFGPIMESVTNIDAAVYWTKFSKLYLFAFHSRDITYPKAIDVDYPRSITANWIGIPNDLSAAILVEDYAIVFIKDNIIRKFGIYQGSYRIFPGYPKFISTDAQWNQLSTVDIHAAMRWLDGNYYAVSGDQYYVLSGTTGNVYYGYPRSFGEDWFGCDMLQDTS